MKKLMTMIITMIMLGLVTVTTQAAIKEIPITSVTGSSNAASTGPVQYLVDGNPGTVWSSATDTTGPLWTELKLSDTVIVDGLQIYGQYQGNLKVEFWQDNQWHSFLAARSLAGVNSSYGWNLIDLSYDRIATNKLRLTLTADQAVKLGGIGEIKVLGRTAVDQLQRLEPVSVSNPSRSQYGYSTAYLFDHDTYTDWRVYGGSPTDAESIADLGESCSIGRIKVYTAPQTKNNPYQGQFKMQYQANNNWYDLPGVSINLAKMGTGWQSFAVSGVNASKFRILLSGTQVMGGIKEVEIWGNRSAVTGSSYFYSSSAPTVLSTASSANYCFNLSDVSSGSFTLHVTGTGGSPDLSWELNGSAMGALTASSLKDGTAFYHVPIDIRRLQAGTNFIRINGSGLTVNDCRIEKSTVYSLEGSNSGLSDRWLLTAASGNENLIDLGGNFHLDQLILQYLGSEPAVQVAVLQNGQWISLAGPAAKTSDTLGGQLIYSGVGAASQIRVSYDSASPGNGPCEMLLYGSAINDGAPQIMITSPLDGQVFTLSQWGVGSFCATLDNPDVTLKINGQPTYFTGTAITLPLPQLGTPQGDQPIEAVVTDAQGRSGSAKITISVSTPPDFTINLAEGITYTTQAQITVSGQVIIPTSQITINGTAVAVKNNKFSIAYPLQEGLNLLTIKLVPIPGSTMVNTLVRQVVRTSSAPYLKVQYPADGQVVNAAQITVSGEVSSLMPVTVTVNGKTATVNSGSFSSSAVALSEGSNTITVVAKDQNGRTSTVTLTVQRDSTAPVLTNILPADGAYWNKLTINVTGTISDASAVAVLVNGVAATVTGKQFSATVPVSEGANTLTIKATDSAGNGTTVTRKVTIDTNPPAAFTPTINISGWSNNNKPTVTFSTTDSESGIDHYEIGVDGGTTIKPVTSPYTFTIAIADGEHTVQVKAVDKAGNSTIGEVKVDIDTTPPAVPASFEAVPGIGRVILDWEDDGGEVKGYRITRGTAFSDGSTYKEVFRANDDQEVAQYVDSDVASGSSYSYTVQAIDHAGNYSPLSAKLTAGVGQTAQTMDSQGGTVQFDDCTLTFAAGAVSTSGQVVMKQTPDALPENNYGTKVGSAYSFSLVDASGNEVATKFSEQVTLTISYADMQIPAGFDIGDLGIYWYNKALGYWEKIDYGFNDVADKTITVNLHHFSDYQVMASKYNSPSMDSYYDMGVSPLQSYFQNNIESVSPSSANLAINATDLKLAGRGGFDLVIKRIYDSAAANQERLMASNKDQSYSTKAPIDTFGCGWSLGIPWIETSDKGKFIRLQDGETIKIDANSNGIFEYHQGAQFILTVHTIMVKTPETEYDTDGLPYTVYIDVPVITGYTLVVNDGSKCEFDSTGRVTTISDPSGINVINFTYNSGNSRQINYITDSIGRKVTFHYKTIGSESVIDSITTGVASENIRTITYGYNNGDDALTDVYDPMQRHTVYAYETHTLQAGSRTKVSGMSGSDKDKRFSYTVDLLNSITYPTGESSTYSYDFKSQDYDETIKKKFLGVTISKSVITYEGTKIFVVKHVSAGKETDYSYTMNTSNLGSFKKSSFVPAYSYLYSSQTTEGDKIINVNYQQIENGSLVDNPSDIDNYKGPLAINNTTTIGDNQEVEAITYAYKFPLTAITSEKHYRGGNLVYSITYDYDGWGNPTYQYNSSNNLEEDWTYANNATIKNLVASRKQVNKNPIKNTTSTVTSTYTYDNYGRPLTTAINDGTHNLATKITYDDYGNVQSKIDESNQSLETDFYYDDTYHVFPAKKVVKAVRDADGNAADITTYCNYNWETGQKISETDARGFTTQYEYDKLDRIIRVILPDDDGDDSNNPYRQFQFDDAKNICVYINEKGQKATYAFDGLGRLTSVVKDTSLYSGGVKTSYHYNTLGQINQVTDTLGNITSYTYDGLNRVTKVTYPDGNFVTLGYDDATNTVKVTDENGGIVTEQKDWADRLILAKQYCAYNGAIDIYTWQFVYDSLGNKLRQIDPKSNQTDQEFDALNHLTSVLMPPVAAILPGGSVPTDYKPKVSYEYNDAGFKTAETSANENAKKSEIKTSYEYDQLGRVIKTTTQATDIFTKQLVPMVAKTYYDPAGNKVRVVDPNGEITQYTYSARGYLLTQTDPEGNVTRSQYDVLGNKTAVTDPRGNGTDGTFTTQYKYDDLNRLVKTIMPDQIDTETTYDAAGNKLTEKDPNGVITSYTYTVRNWVETVSQNGELKAKYVYDAKGNQIETDDALNNVIRKEYDSLGRMRKVTQQGASTITVEYTYDALGNKVAAKDGRGNTTTSTYNGLGWLTSVRDPLLNQTQYFYDPNGNQVKVITAKGLTIQNRYDELNRVTESFDPLNHFTQCSYDPAGNRQKIVDRRGTTWTYQYTPDNLLKRLDLIGADGSSYSVEYTYDAAGNREQVADSGNTIQYNFSGGTYQADPMNRLNSVDRSFDGASYRTAYQYDKAGLLTQIKYPQANDWLQYNYNNLNQLSEVKGFASGMTYDANGALTSMTYANGARTTYSYDTNNRLQNYQVTLNGTSLLQQQFSYDNNNNITAITEGSNTKNFDYDADNQLTRAITPGKFLESDPTPGTYGIKIGDYLGAKIVDFTPVLTAMMGLDYNSSSIGIDFGSTASGVKKIQVIPDGKFTVHRITQRTLDLYTSSDNSTYTMIPRNNWTFVTDSKGVITITLAERLSTRYLKVHVKFDERDSYFAPQSKATFLNDFAKMVRIYQEAASRTEEFQYDADGNRTYQRVTLIQSKDYSSSYYTNSDRLKTDGKYAFVYDDAGNLVKKGNKFTISGDTVTFTATSGDGVEYWQYTYDLLNRLTEVTKTGVVVSDYEYSPDGLREVKRGSKGTIHYVFEGTEPIFEKNITSGKIKSYVYALGKHLARVDGVIGDSTAKIYYYHTDYLGSVRVITDQNGKVVFSADYLAFGTKFVSNGDFDETHGFTGKDYDSDTGLYYFDARWYDPDLGRFISEDPTADPNNPNLYSYCGNNGVIRSDPTGQCWVAFAVVVIVAAAAGAIDAYCNGGNPLIGAFVGAVSGAIGYCCGALCGPALAGTLTAVGAAAVGGALSGGIMAALMGNNVWAGVRTGAISGAISGWLGTEEKGSSAGNAPTGNAELTSTQKWFNNAFGSFAANGGNYKFGAADVLALCGAEDSLDEAFGDSKGQAEVVDNDSKASTSGGGGDNSGYNNYMDRYNIQEPEYLQPYQLPEKSTASSNTGNDNSTNVKKVTGSKAYWEYHQSTGELYKVDATGKKTLFATGYAGLGPSKENGLNNPDMENVKYVTGATCAGPLPRGWYTIGKYFDNKGATGPDSMLLTPEAGTNMFGRDKMYIHGPNSTKDINGAKMSSEGCIIINYNYMREAIYNSGVHGLEVVK